MTPQEEFEQLCAIVLERIDHIKNTHYTPEVKLALLRGALQSQINLSRGGEEISC